MLPPPTSIALHSENIHKSRTMLIVCWRCEFSPTFWVSKKQKCLCSLPKLMHSFHYIILTVQHQMKEPLRPYFNDALWKKLWRTSCDRKRKHWKENSTRKKRERMKNTFTKTSSCFTVFSLVSHTSNKLNRMLNDLNQNCASKPLIICQHYY